MNAKFENINYEDFIPLQNGFVFKFEKQRNDFIHTYIEGDLLKKLGLSPAMIVGKTLFDFLPERDAEQKLDYYKKAWRGEFVNYEGYANGIHYLASLSPSIKDAEVVEVIATALEITNEKENEEMIKKVEKLALVGELAAGIAHEIRNPLTSLKGFTQMIKGSIDNQDLDQYFDIMLEELERINTIVNEFMIIAKPNQNIHMKKTNINLLISNVIRFMEPQSNLKSIKLKTSFETDIDAVCDSDHIKQVLINLIQNAIEATSDNKKDIDIFLKEVNADTYLIQIWDRGCGISEKRQKRLFEPFYSTKEQGTGLGLMVCKRLIELHNGEIEIISKKNYGTTVKIILPKYIGVSSEEAVVEKV